jgi:hypothetical protein
MVLPSVSCCRAIATPNSKRPPSHSVPAWGRRPSVRKRTACAALPLRLPAPAPDPRRLSKRTRECSKITDPASAQGGVWRAILRVLDETISDDGHIAGDVRCPKHHQYREHCVARPGARARESHAERNQAHRLATMLARVKPAPFRGPAILTLVRPRRKLTPVPTADERSHRAQRQCKDGA